MKKILTIIVLSLLLLPVSAQQIEAPSLIVGICVDGLDELLMSKFWSEFSKGGFRKMASQGAWFQNASYPCLFNDGVGDMVILSTASSPFVNGVASASTLDRKGGRMVPVIDDASVTGLNDKRHFSARRIVATTIGDEIYNSTIGTSKIVSIAIDPSHSIAAAGHCGAAYWMNNLTGEWASSTYWMPSLPDWVVTRNSANGADSYLDKTWNPKFPVGIYVTAPLSKTDFSYNLRSVCGSSGLIYENFATTPFANDFVCDMAVASIDAEKMGRDLNPDLLMVTFSLKPFFKKSESGLCQELEDAYLRLDLTLKRLMETAEIKVGKGKVLFYLTTTRNMVNRTDYVSRNIPSNAFSIERYRALLNSYLMAAYGKKRWVVAAGNGNIYLDRQMIEANNLVLRDVQEKALEFFSLIPGVASIATAYDMNQQWMSANGGSVLPYNRETSGDLLYSLQPNWYEIGAKDIPTGYAANYGRSVPFFMYGWKVLPAKYGEPTDIRSLVGTICSWVGAYPPNGSGQEKVDVSRQE